MSLRQRNKQAVRARILNEAGVLIAAEGLEATTMRAISERAEISYQTLYNYFPKKSDVVRGLLDAELALWAEQVQMLIKRYDGDLVGSLVGLQRLALEMIGEDSDQIDLWRNLAKSFLIEVESDGGDHVAGLTASVIDQIQALLTLAQGMGHLDGRVDLALLSRVLFSLTDHGLLLYLIHGVDAEVFLRTQREQIELVVQPYLT